MNNTTKECESISKEKNQTNDNTLNENSKAQLWHKIDWKDVNNTVAKTQEEILNAMEQKDWNKVRKLQRKLIIGFPGRAMAVRKVITNKGGRTPGSDNITLETPEEYYEAIKELKKIVENPMDYKAQPVRRIYIPKPGKKELRPLGIPTIKDRMVQAVYHLSIDPIVEAQSDLNSFGFRKERSTHDAINYFRNYMDKHWSPQWVLEADIEKCFDRIDHEYLIKHTPICDKHMVEEWLKAGMIEGRKRMTTEEGTPQGGIISPLLCNIALNGLEETIKKDEEIKKEKTKVKVIRYADDIIVTGNTPKILMRCREIITDFMAKRGLKLSENKTRISNIEDGINLLGFNIKRLPWNFKYNAESKQNKVLIIKPTEKGLKTLKQKIKSIIKSNQKIEMIIREINPILRGWAEHKRITPHSRKAYFEIDNYVWQLIRATFVRARPGNSRVRRNFEKISKDKGRFGTDNSLIYNMGRTTSKRLRLKKLELNPYLLTNKQYFLDYKEKKILSTVKEKLYKKYKHLCNVCGESLHGDEVVEIHHIKPIREGGTNKLSNLMPLHSICHRKVTHNK